MAGAITERVRALGIVGYTDPEIEFFYETMALAQPDLVVEWGTNVGESARIFHESRVLLDLDCEIHSVDIAADVPILRPEDEGKVRGHYVLDVPVALHVGYGAQEAVSLYALSDSVRPLLFSDDNHGEETMMADLTMLAREIPEAVILIHDASLTMEKWSEADRAARNFATLFRDQYVADEHVSSGCFVRLWPR